MSTALTSLPFATKLKGTDVLAGVQLPKAARKFALADIAAFVGAGLPSGGTGGGSFGSALDVRNYSSLQAAIDASYAARNTVNTGYGLGTGPPVYVPYSANIDCGGTKIVISHTMRLFGDSNGHPTASGSLLFWDGTTTGIEIESTAPGTIIEGLSFVGGFLITNTEGEFHAIKRFATSTVRQCNMREFPGDAVNDDENFGGGQTNCSVIDTIFVENCRDSHAAFGADANAGRNVSITSKGNRRSNINQGGFLGDHYYSCESNAAGRTLWNSGAAGHHAGYCHVAGLRYAAMLGQEIWCSANPPYSSTVTMTIASPGVITWTAHGLPNDTKVGFSTTGALPTGLTAGTIYYVVNATTNSFQVAATKGGAAINTTGSQSGTHTSAAEKHNQGWLFWQEGPADTTGVPTYFAGMAVRACGAYLHSDVNNRSTFVGCYAEDNNPSQFDLYAVLVQPFMAAKWRVNAGTFYGDADAWSGDKLQVRFQGNSSGDTVPLCVFGPTSVAARSGASSVSGMNVSALCHNDVPLATFTMTGLAFAQGFEADGVTACKLAVEFAYSSSAVIASNVGNWGIATRASGGTMTERITYDTANASFRSWNDATDDLGTASQQWKRGYFSSGVYVGGNQLLTARQTKPATPTLTDVVNVLVTHGLWA